jgi:hypothetical protein
MQLYLVVRKLAEGFTGCLAIQPHQLADKRAKALLVAEDLLDQERELQLLFSTWLMHPHLVAPVVYYVVVSTINDLKDRVFRDAAGRQLVHSRRYPA